MSSDSGGKPILTLKILVIYYCKFQYFTDFDIKIVLLNQNSLVGIAF